MSSIISEEEELTLTIPRSVLEALASAAIIRGMDPGQQAYEKWLDDMTYEGPWPQIPWDDLSTETQGKWKASLRRSKLPDAKPKKPCTHVQKTFPPRKKAWIATSLGDVEVVNKPKCPLCTSLKKSIPCKGGPPCTECFRKGYTSEECQNYVPGNGNKGRRKRPHEDGEERPAKRARVRTKPLKAKAEDVERRKDLPSLLAGEEAWCMVEDDENKE